jgi:hypothetical protein
MPVSHVGIADLSVYVSPSRIGDENHGERRGTNGCVLD